MIFALVGFCLPVFWLGLMLQILFGLQLDWLPVSGMHTPGQTGFMDMLKYLVLPSISLAAGSTAVIARMTRSSMLEVIRQDYIKNGKGEGTEQQGDRLQPFTA